MTAGVLVAVVALVCATVFGLWWRSRDGRLRVVAPSTPPGSDDLLHSSPGLSAGTSADVAARSDIGASTSLTAGSPVAGSAMAGSRAAGAAADAESAAAEGGRIAPEVWEALGVDRTAGATLLQFSSAFCQPCRAVRRISSEVAAIVPGVRHVEVDAESHLDVVRALRIRRTPTLLILDRDGREVRRATGVPTKPQLIAALGQVLTT